MSNEHSTSGSEQEPCRLIMGCELEIDGVYDEIVIKRSGHLGRTTYTVKQRPDGRFRVKEADRDV